MINERIVFNENAQCFELSATDTVPENLVRAVEVALTILAKKFCLAKQDILDTSNHNSSDARVILCKFIRSRARELGDERDEFVYRFFENKRAVEHLIKVFGQWEHLHGMHTNEVSLFKELCRILDTTVPTVFGTNVRQGNQEVPPDALGTQDVNIVFLSTTNDFDSSIGLKKEQFDNDSYFEILLLAAERSFRINRKHIRSNSRGGKIPTARKFVMREMRNYFGPGISFSKIGSYFEGMSPGKSLDHSTVMSAIGKLAGFHKIGDDKYIKDNTRFMRELGAILSEIPNYTLPSKISLSCATEIVEQKFNGQSSDIIERLKETPMIPVKDFLAIVTSSNQNINIEEIQNFIK